MPSILSDRYTGTHRYLTGTVPVLYKHRYGGMFYTPRTDVPVFLGSFCAFFQDRYTALYRFLYRFLGFSGRTGTK